MPYAGPPLASGVDTLQDMQNLVTLRINRPCSPSLLERGVELDAEVRALLAAHAPVAVGVSGGKDSCAAAIAVVEHLRAIGHKGPVVLVHADLGHPDPRLNVEWDDSLPTCERLAAFLGVPLVVTKRPAGGMMKRWIKRWENNVKRYAEMSCVKIILPWSTPSMRFCTSELKKCADREQAREALPRPADHQRVRHPPRGGQRQGNLPRTNAPTSKENKRLSKQGRTSGVDWNPIAAWSTTDAFSFCAARGFQMNEGYALGMSRISCRFCIMQDLADQCRPRRRSPPTPPCSARWLAWRSRSTFAFQGSRWLGDVAPQLLDAATCAALAGGQEARCQARPDREAHPQAPALYEGLADGHADRRKKPSCSCGVRREVAALLGIEVRCTEPAELIARYADLMAQKAVKETAIAKKVARKVMRKGAAA